MSSPHGSIPSIRSDLMTIPSERPPSERSSLGGPSVIITDDINCLLQYLHGLEGDRQRDNQGIHDHLGEIQNKLRSLADYMHEKEASAVLPPAQFKNQSVGGSSVVSRPSPCEAPPPIPPTVTSKASPRLSPIPLSPPPPRPDTPTSLSDTISFLSSYHSDDFSLMESELFIEQPPSLSSTPSIIFNTVISVKLSLIQDTPFDAHITVSSLIRRISVSDLHRNHTTTSPYLRIPYPVSGLERDSQTQSIWHRSRSAEPHP
jgi:hypothetical protein